MTDSGVTESVVEQAALAWFESVGWAVAHGPDIGPDGSASERSDYRQVVLTGRLRDALARLNPNLPSEALDDALRKSARPEGLDLILQNRSAHEMMVHGINVEYRGAGGAIRGAQTRVVDFDDPEANDWLVVNQFSVTEAKHGRRPDIVLFLNGIPVGVVELKDASDENATIWSAHAQLRTYQAEVPSLFATNAVLVVSDGVAARVGALGAGREWFKPWRTIDGEELADEHLPQLQVVIEGLCDHRRLLDLIRDFVVFEDDGEHVIKKLAGYHQFHAVQAGVAETLRATDMVAVPDEAEATRGGKPGDRRIGAVWHTQGSGKSLTMAFYAGRIIREPAMKNPTIVGFFIAGSRMMRPA